MDKGRGDSPQFRDPRFDVRAMRIVPSLLQPRIENPKIWLRIAAGRRAPLPVSIVDRGIVVHKLLRKVAPPQRQSMCRSFVRKDATIILTRLSKNPVAFSSRIPASTIGNPVFPAHHALNFAGSVSHTI